MVHSGLLLRKPLPRTCFACQNSELQLQGRETREGCAPARAHDPMDALRERMEFVGTVGPWMLCGNRRKLIRTTAGATFSTQQVCQLPKIPALTPALRPPENARGGAFSAAKFTKHRKYRCGRPVRGVREQHVGASNKGALGLEGLSMRQPHTAVIAVGSRRRWEWSAGSQKSRRARWGRRPSGARRGDVSEQGKGERERRFTRGCSPGLATGAAACLHLDYRFSLPGIYQDPCSLRIRYCQEVLGPSP